MKIEDPEQVVLEAEPGRRLAYTWHTFTPRWAETNGFDAAARATLTGQPRSTVTFDLEPVGDAVKLTVTHDGGRPGATVLELVGEGWPALLSSLKTLLETGQPLPAGPTG
ncbi:SRPBCC domain-containing protein [Micromonospora zhanjiangensis]